MAKVDLLKKYPKIKRDTKNRASQKTPYIRAIARKFDKDFFDGDRIFGYGGFTYHPRYWQPVIPDFQRHYNLNCNSKVLDVGCAKGFMLYDFLQLIPGVTVAGIDLSEYAISHAIPEVKPFLQVANAKNLPFTDKSFDLIISINTIHNLPLKECKRALKEIMRVSKKFAFITVDAYTNEEQKNRMFDWNLTAKTILSELGWENMFNEVGYSGDYYWFTP